MPARVEDPLFATAVSLLLALAAPAYAGSRAEELMLAGRLSEALPVARSEAADPADVEAQERYVDCMLAAGLQKQAESIYRARLDQHPTDPDAHYLVGRAVATAQEARDAYEHALKLNPDHARSHMGMGAVYRALGQYADAEAAYRRATSLDPSLGEAWTGLAMALLAEDKSDDALAAARSAVTNAPDTSEGYIEVAVLSPADAEKVLKQGVAAVPKDPRLHVALAEVYLGRNDGASAEVELDRALTIDPTRSDAILDSLFARAEKAKTIDADGYQALVAARQQEEKDAAGAAKQVDALIAKYPKCPLPYMSRARLRTASGDAAGAEADLRQALALDAHDTEAQAALGMLLLDQKRPADAKPLLSAAASARPYDASLAVAAAQAEAASGDAPAAEKRLAAAATKWPADVRVTLVRAKTLSEAGDRESAYVVLRDGVQKNQDARLVLALAAAATDTGRFTEAADILDAVSRQIGDPTLHDTAEKLRAKAH